MGFFDDLIDDIKQNPGIWGCSFFAAFAVPIIITLIILLFSLVFIADTCNRGCSNRGYNQRISKEEKAIKKEGRRYYKQAEKLRKLKKYDEAIAAYNLAALSSISLAFYSEYDSKVYYGLGLCYLEKQNILEAIRCLNRATGTFITPGHPEARSMLTKLREPALEMARKCIAEEDYVNALDYYLEGYDAIDKSFLGREILDTDFYNIMLAYYKTGEYQESLRGIIRDGWRYENKEQNKERFDSLVDSIKQDYTPIKFNLRTIVWKYYGGYGVIDSTTIRNRRIAIVFPSSKAWLIDVKLDVSGKWVHVLLDSNKEGWVASKYVEYSRY